MSSRQHSIPFLNKIVKGRSMYPFLKEGDLIGYIPVESPDINIGDVLLCRNPLSAGLLSHRVIRKKGKKIYLKGDNELSRPLPVEISAVEGKIVLLRRNGRNLSLKTILHRLFSRIIALFSSINLTPGNLRERFILQIYDRFLANFLKAKCFELIVPVRYRYFKFCEPGTPAREFKIRAFDNKNRASASINLNIKSMDSVKTGFIAPWTIRRRARGRNLSRRLLEKIIELAAAESLGAILAYEKNKKVLPLYRELGFSEERWQDGEWWMAKRDFTAP